jgi:hypothetical protein
MPRGVAHRGQADGTEIRAGVFSPHNVCLVRYDNSHSADTRSGRVPYDHWHRFARDEIVPYSFIDTETLLADFFADIDQHLPPHLRSD